jgi:Acetyltransferase (GNAT) domain
MTVLRPGPAQYPGVAFYFRKQEPDMLQDIPTPTLRESTSCVLETERLTLRRPTLADVKAIAFLANDRRIAENTRRLPHPYLQDHAIEFVRAMADSPRETVFLIEHNFTPIGVVGVDWRQSAAPELGYWLGFEHWGQGFGTEAARGDRFHLRGIRCRAPDFRRARDQSVVPQHPGEMRIPVERRRVAPLRSAGVVDAGRLLPPFPRGLVLAEELGQLDQARAIALCHRPRERGDP